MKSTSAFISPVIPRTTCIRSYNILQAKTIVSSSLSGIPSSDNAPSFQKPTITSVNKQETIAHTAREVTISRSAPAPRPISSETYFLRDAYGSARASTESCLMAKHATMLLKNNVVDAETAATLSNPWHAKGELVMHWDKTYLNPTLAAPIDIMDLEKAKRIALRKDAAERKWLEDWRAGIIDDDGNPISQVKEASTLESELSSAPQDISPPFLKKAPVVEKKGVPKKETAKKVVSDRNAKPATLVKKTLLETIRDVSLPELQRPIPPPVTKLQPSPRSRPLARKNKPSDFPVPEVGYPDYANLNFFEIIAIGRERGLVTGGSIWKNRERLILDDKAIKYGTERELAAYSRAGARQFKTKAPVVKGAPVVGSNTRKAGDESEEGLKKKQKVKK